MINNKEKRVSNSTELIPKLCKTLFSYLVVIIGFK